MRHYLLDTNTVSHALRGHSKVLARMTAVPMASLGISAITEGELLFGLARRPEAVKLQALVEEFLRRVDVLPWDRNCAARYGPLRAAMGERGRTLAPLDLLIAAHAQSLDAVLVSNDKAFSQCEGLAWEDWSA
ncbi:MAG: type II toxin-antitoxin system VapC family toxin [Xanthomonadales bacterium]|nr:type II toxin-antitoxin system VapC family toxin [Xanthomonadales bacterium]